MKTGTEILEEYRNQEQDISTFITLEEMIDRELETARSVNVDQRVMQKIAELEKEFKEKFVIKTKDKMGFDNYSYKQFRFADGIWVWIKEKLSNFSA